jgi:iron(III) transport system ATP-binding protein
LLEIENLHMVYQSDRGPVYAVRGVSFTVADGDFYTLLGPSGCGKTSTLRSIAGLETPSSGRITIGDQVVYDSETHATIPSHRRDIGMVFQSYAIWPHMTVFDNVAFPLVHGRTKTPKSEVRDRVMQALSLVHLEHLGDRPAPQLSGGQQQRVALARALVHEPAVLLLDEPLSNLDAKLREEMRQELKDLVSRLHITTLYVTHDQVEALTMSDSLAVMEEGLIVQEGEPRSVYLQPATGFVANFMGRANAIDGKVISTAPDQGLAQVGTTFGPLTCVLPTWAQVNDSVLAVFRPESVELAPESAWDGPNVLEGKIEQVVFAGESIEYVIAVAEQLISAKGDPFETLAEGDKVFMHIQPRRCLLVKTSESISTNGASAVTVAAEEEPTESA